MQQGFKRENDDEPQEQPDRKRGKQQVQGRMDGFLMKGTKHDEFHYDVVNAFATCNVPLSKLDKGLFHVELSMSIYFCRERNARFLPEVHESGG